PRAIASGVWRGTPDPLIPAEAVRLKRRPDFDPKGDKMPTYVMLTNLTAEGVRTLKNNPGRVAEVNREVEQIGAKVVAQYATLGQYDFVTIIEAPDEKTMAKVSVELGSRGTMTSQTLAAMPAEDLSSSL
ncbi:MAG TPA: GYD domain-containing protein, partial [Solirubrobacterales bacterium]